MKVYTFKLIYTFLSIWHLNMIYTLHIWNWDLILNYTIIFFIIFFIITVALHFLTFSRYAFKKFNVETVSRLYFSVSFVLLSYFFIYLLSFAITFEHWKALGWHNRVLHSDFPLQNDTFWNDFWNFEFFFCVGKIAYLKNFIFFITEGLD